MMFRSTRARTILAVAGRPDLWFTLVRLAYRLVPNQWWRGGLWPPKEYRDFRASVYGAPLSEIPPQDFIYYLDWNKTYPRAVRRQQQAQRG